MILRGFAICVSARAWVTSSSTLPSAWPPWPATVGVFIRNRSKLARYCVAALRMITGTSGPRAFEELIGPVLVEDLGDLASNREGGIERLARILEDHCDAVAADRQHLFMWDREQIDRIVVVPPSLR